MAVATVTAITLASIVVAFNPEWIRALGQWGYVGAFVINAVASATIIIPIPGLAVAMAMGTAFNPWILGLVSGLGSAVGELTGYVAGASGRTLIPAEQQHHYERLEGWTRRYGALAVFGTAAIPFPLFDLVGIAAGAMRMPILVFMAATAAGKVVKYTITILLAAGIVQQAIEWFN
jgi:membrane protein YqaA with SNARE-associated domain